MSSLPSDVLFGVPPWELPDAGPPVFDPQEFQALSAEMGALMASHVVGVQRRSGSGFVDVEPGGLVRPLEPIRYTTSGGGINGILTTHHFQVINLDTGSIVLDRDVWTNAAANGWIDDTAPSQEGTYQLDVFQSGRLPGAPHDSVFVFQVSNNAPQPPPPPPGQTDWLNTVKWIAIAGLGIVIVSNVGRVVR